MLRGISCKSIHHSKFNELSTDGSYRLSDLLFTFCIVFTSLASANLCPRADNAGVKSVSPQQELLKSYGGDPFTVYTLRPATSSVSFNVQQNSVKEVSTIYTIGNKDRAYHYGVQYEGPRRVFFYKNPFNLRCEIPFDHHDVPSHYWVRDVHY